MIKQNKIDNLNLYITKMVKDRDKFWWISNKSICCHNVISAKILLTEGVDDV